MFWGRSLGLQDLFDRPVHAPRHRIGDAASDGAINRTIDRVIDSPEHGPVAQAAKQLG